MTFDLNRLAFFWILTTSVFVIANISSLSFPPAFGQQIAAVTLESEVKSHSLEMEVVSSQIQQVIVEIIQPGFNPHRAELNWQEIDQ